MLLRVGKLLLWTPIVVIFTVPLFLPWQSCFIIDYSAAGGLRGVKHIDTLST